MPKKLLIIPGHGAGDSGACAAGKQEAVLVRQLAARCKAWGGSKVKRTAYKRNYYADKGINNLGYSTKKWRIVELHMDSAGATAKGAHIIVRDKADTCDKALAQALSKMLPGRAETIVYRSDLGNANRAHAKGYDYALAEIGFISNKHDREYVEAHMDDIAKAILQAHGIVPRSKPINVKCPW